MTATAPDADRTSIDLTRPEQWVLHAVMLDRCETARDEGRTPPWWAVDVLEKLEAGTPAFTSFEAWRLRQDLEEYADGEAVPPAEVNAARGVVAELDEAFETPPAAFRW